MGILEQMVVLNSGAQRRLPNRRGWRHDPRPLSALRTLPSIEGVEAIYRRPAFIVDKILKGTKPAQLPAEQPAKFELLVNTKTAKSLGTTIAPIFLARADVVIE